MIKAIFFDIDGTMADAETHRPSPKTIRALNELHQRGMKLFIATGRHTMVRAQSYILDLFPEVFDGFVGMNGLFCHLADGRSFHKTPFSPGDARAIEQHAIKGGIPYMILEENRIYVREKNEIVDCFNAAVGLPLPEVAATPPDYGNIYMFTFYGEFGKENDGKLPECSVMRWADGASDIVPKGGGKHIGMLAALNYFGLTREECMAFGDEGNDIQMLETAGVGVAMGNARPDVKAAADFVTLNCEDDGIYAALKHYQLI